MSLFETESLVKSPLNYIGGKSKLLPQILPLFPRKIRRFVDLFCGGCNVGINVSADTIFFNDNLRFLIETYREFRRRDEEEIFMHLRERITEFNLSETNEAGYRALRKCYNTHKNPLDLFVLCAYSFNHQIRFNNAGEFNNPFGKNRSKFNPTMEKNLRAFLKKIKRQNVRFSALDFEDFDFSDFDENDFVYCDPPYLISTGTYNDGKRGFRGWSEDEEYALLELLSRLSQQGVRFALSNVLTHKNEENSILKSWAETAPAIFVHRLKFDYTNSNYQQKNRALGTSTEVLITNFASPVVPVVEKQLQFQLQ